VVGGLPAKPVIGAMTPDAVAGHARAPEPLFLAAGAVARS
jgi:hypothetical protein